MNSITVDSLAAMLSLILLTVAVSHYTSSKLVFSLGELQRITDGIPIKIIREESIEWPVTSVAEISGLIGNFRQMTESLRQSFSELKTVNDTLEQRIQEHTRELAATIEEYKKTEDALPTSEIRLKEAQEIAHLGNWEWDIVSNTLWWSDETFHIFGMKKDEEVTVEKFLNAIHPEDRNYVHTLIRNAAKEGRPAVFEYRIQMKDGTVKYAHEETQTICVKEGRALKRIGTVQDITARKQSEDAMRESEERYRLLVWETASACQQSKY